MQTLRSIPRVSALRRRWAVPAVLFAAAYLGLLPLCGGRGGPVARAAAPPPASASQLIEQGRDAQDAGKIAEAVRHFESAESAARQAGDKHLEAFARNCRAVVAFTQGAAGDAIPLLQGLPLDPSDPRAHVYRYNLGRALESERDTHAALKQYEAALSLKPDFQQAADRCYSLLVTGSESPNVDRAVWAGEALLNGGQPRLAANRTLDMLAKWGRQQKSFRLLTLLGRCYVAASVEPREFAPPPSAIRPPNPDGAKPDGRDPDRRDPDRRDPDRRDPDRPKPRPNPRIQPAVKSDDQKLAELAGQFPTLKPRIDELRRAYTQEGAALEEAEFPAWKADPEARPVLSAVLKTAGDGYVRLEKLGEGVARYRAAWQVDPGNIDAAVYYAALLREHGRSLDPDGRKLKDFVGHLFNQKSQAYAGPLTTKEDWTNLLRLHTTLAGIFERGGPDFGGGSFYTAAYQWDRAVRAQQEVRRIDPTFVESARPHLRLAEVLKKDRPAEAWTQYLAAAEKFGAARNKKEASDAVKAASLLGQSIQLSEDQLKRFKSTEVMVNDLREPGDQQGRIIFLPKEYDRAGVEPEKREELIRVSQKYELQARQNPLRAGEIEVDKKKELDKLLTQEQRQRVEQSRPARQKAGGD